LRKIRRGDAQAFESLIERHRPFLRQVIELRLDSRLQPRVDPSDIVQEVQLEVFRRMPDYLERRPMPFRLWLRKTAQERLLKTQRKHLETGRRTLSREVPLPDRSSLALAQQMVASGASPSSRLERRELIERIRQAVAKLSEADRDILLMRNFEGMSNQEVAFSLDVDSATASKRHGRALLRLRQALLDGGLTESQQ
jgi:RNA polymerase sigma-70 factor (ECF subfamily)